ncbi:hypothetical protein BDV35DRAFT_340802 [Aspergillus flavus]|uniref:Uncharacterized protein n=1 Tax=Aspergillus flavus TaxID=5059 RepID=A0A5N6HBS5_ASPFL|nr:hypothetical protein BDV35DRAFT_340802 [Aspergillus flavus]
MTTMNYLLSVFAWGQSVPNNLDAIWKHYPRLHPPPLFSSPNDHPTGYLMSPSSAIDR